MNRQISSILDFLGKLSTFVTLFSLSAVWVIHARFLYQISLSLFHIKEAVNFSERTILANYDALMRYMNHPFQKVLSMPDFPSSSQGLKHFGEVKGLFLLASALLIFSIVPTIFYLRRIKREKSFWRFLFPVKVIFSLIACLSVFFVTGFEQFFVLFHEVLFRNNDWIYDPACDPVIQILPEGYFMLCFGAFFVSVLLGLFVLYLLGKRSIKSPLP